MRQQRQEGALDLAALAFAVPLRAAGSAQVEAVATERVAGKVAVAAGVAEGTALAEAERHRARMRQFGQRPAADDAGAGLGQLAFGDLAVGAVQHVGDREVEEAVAEELEPLVARFAFVAHRRMGQRAIEQVEVVEAVAEPRREFAKRAAAGLLLDGRRIDHRDRAT